MLVVGCVLLAVSFLTALTSTILISKATSTWYAGETEAEIPWSKDQKDVLKSFRYSQCIAGLFMWVLAIISCEKIIQWNGLSPENDLSRPGQAIPLVVGILILMDGILNLLKEPARFINLGTWTKLLRQVTLGSLKYWTHRLHRLVGKLEAKMNRNVDVNETTRLLFTLIEVLEGSFKQVPLLGS
jgi:hypothetical protein